MFIEFTDVELILFMADKLQVAIIFLLISYTLGEIYEINLDLPPNERYTELSRIKKDSITRFISHLKTEVEKYKISFQAVAILHKMNSRLIKRRVGNEFY